MVEKTKAELLEYIDECDQQRDRQSLLSLAISLAEFREETWPKMNHLGKASRADLVAKLKNCLDAYFITADTLFELEVEEDEEQQGADNNEFFDASAALNDNLSEGSVEFGTDPPVNDPLATVSPSANAPNAAPVQLSSGDPLQQLQANIAALTQNVAVLNQQNTALNQQNTAILQQLSLSQGTSQPPASTGNRRVTLASGTGTLPAGTHTSAAPLLQSSTAPGLATLAPYSPSLTPSAAAHDMWSTSTEARLQLVANASGGLIGQIAAYIDQFVTSPADGFPPLVQALSSMKASDRMSGGQVAAAASKQTHFNGDTKGVGTSFKFWLYSTALQALSVPPSHQLVYWGIIFTQCLTGDAQEHYKSIRLDKRNSILYVLDTLASLYRLDRKLAVAADWYNLRAEKGESVAKLHRRLCSTFHTISETMDDAEREKMIGNKLFSEVDRLLPENRWLIWRKEWQDGSIRLVEAVMQMDMARSEIQHTKAPRNESSANFKGQNRRRRNGRSAEWGSDMEAAPAAAVTNQPAARGRQSGSRPMKKTFDASSYKGPWCTYHLHPRPAPHDPSACYFNPNSAGFQADKAEQAKERLRNYNISEDDAKRRMREQCNKQGIKPSAAPTNKSKGNPGSAQAMRQANTVVSSQPAVEDLNTWFPSTATVPSNQFCEHSVAEVQFYGCTVKGVIDSGCDLGLLIDERFLESIWKQAGKAFNKERAKYKPYPWQCLGSVGDSITAEHLRTYDMHLRHTLPSGQKVSGKLTAVVKLKEFCSTANDPVLFGHHALYGPLQLYQRAIAEHKRLASQYSPQSAEATPRNSSACTIPIRAVARAIVPAGAQRQILVSADKGIMLEGDAGNGKTGYVLTAQTRNIGEDQLTTFVPDLACTTVLHPDRTILDAPNFSVCVTNTSSDDLQLQADMQIAEVFPTSRVLVAEDHVDPPTVAKTRQLPMPPDPIKSVDLDTPLTEAEEAYVNEVWGRLPETACDSLPSNLRDKFRRLLGRQEGLFSLSEYDIGRTHVLDHKIDLVPDAEPVKCAVRFETPPKRAFVWRAVDEMLQRGIIVPSSSPWAFPLVIVPKGTDDYRLCVDFRCLNELTIRDAYPLPRIADMLLQLSGRSVFSVMDASFGYYNIAITDPDTRGMVTFVCSRGQFSYTCMPLGLVNAGADFQRLMDCVIAYLNAEPDRPSFFAYIDDALVASDSPEQHCLHLAQFFARLRWAGIRLKPEKCQFFSSKVRFLGFEVSANGISPKQSNVAAILEQPVPTTKQAMKRFLGQAGYFSYHIPAFHRQQAPLQALCKGAYTAKGSDPIPPFEEWPAVAQKAYESLKLCLGTAPVLAHIDHEKPFYLYSDASEVGLGAVLMQEDGRGHLRPIAFVSKCLPSSHRNWSVIEKEALAVTWALDRLGSHIDGGHVKVRTDHKALVTALTKPTKGKIERWTQRWAMRISLKNLEVEYVPGEHNVVADALSRAPIDEINDAAFTRASETIKVPLDKIVPRVSATTFPGWAKMQADDPEVSKICDALNNGTVNHANFRMENGVLLYRGTRGFVPFCPAENRQHLIRMAHAGLTGAHGGISRTLQQLTTTCAWPRMAQDVQTYVGQCAVCKTTKDAQRTCVSPLFPVEPGSRPFLKVAVDTTPMPVFAGHRHILVIVDYLTRAIALAPLRNANGRNVCSALERELIHRFGAPAMVISDNGTEFVNKDVAALFEKWGIQHRRTTPYHSRANGLAERAFRSVEQAIRQWSVHNESKDWPRALPEIQFRLNLAYNHDVAHAPFELLFGYAPSFLGGAGELGSDENFQADISSDKNGNIDKSVPSSSPPPTSQPHDRPSDNTRFKTFLRSLAAAIPVLAERPGNLAHLWRKARTCLKQAQLRYKQAFDKSASRVKLKIGDSVFWRKPANALSVDRKIEPLYSGPFDVVGLDRSVALIDTGNVIRRVPTDSLILSTSNSKSALMASKSKKSRRSQPEPPAEEDPFRVQPSDNAPPVRNDDRGHRQHRQRARSPVGRHHRHRNGKQLRRDRYDGQRRERAADWRGQQANSSRRYSQHDNRHERRDDSGHQRFGLANPLPPAQPPAPTAVVERDVLVQRAGDHYSADIQAVPTDRVLLDPIADLRLLNGLTTSNQKLRAMKDMVARLKDAFGTLQNAKNPDLVDKVIELTEANCALRQERDAAKGKIQVVQGAHTASNNTHKGEVAALQAQIEVLLSTNRQLLREVDELRLQHRDSCILHHELVKDWRRDTGATSPALPASLARRIKQGTVKHHLTASNEPYQLDLSHNYTDGEELGNLADFAKWMESHPIVTSTPAINFTVTTTATHGKPISHTSNLPDTELPPAVDNVSGDTEPGDAEPGDTEPGDTEPGNTELDDGEQGNTNEFPCDESDDLLGEFQSEVSEAQLVVDVGEAASDSDDIATSSAEAGTCARTRPSQSSKPKDQAQARQQIWNPFT